MHRVPPRPFLLLLVALLLAPQALRAGSYGPQAFSYPNGTKNLGDGTAISSSNGVGSVQGNSLRLTQNGTGGTNSSFKLPDLDPGLEIETFTLTFSLRMSTSGTPADGASVNFGNIPAGDGGGEGGFGMANGLVVAWDTYDNGGDPQSIEVFSNGASIGNFLQNFGDVHNQWVAVAIHWDGSGLDLSYNGNALATNLPTPGFVPAPGDRLAFSGRTGGATQDTFIDDLHFSTDSLAPVQTGGPVISEFLASNSDGLEDEDLDRSDWIEIYNGQDASVNLAGYALTADPSLATLWPLPSITLGAYEYMVVFASGKDRPHTSTPPHTDFTLKRAGGYVALLDPDGETVLSALTFGEQAVDISYGELGHARTLGFLETPTPGAKNAGLQADAPPAEDVVFSRPGGLFSGSVALSIAAPASPTAVVRYTSDNSVPHASSPAYESPFDITETTPIRARVFDTDRLPSPVMSRTFIELAPNVQNFSSALPIVVADSHGVNVDAASNPGAARPFRPVYSVTIDTDPADGLARIDGPPDFNGRGGMHVRGQSSSGFPKKQYAWELWNNEDEDKNESILGMPSESDWILHAPYSDKTLMRNVLVYTRARELGGNASGVRTRFVELFFNQGGGPVSMADYQGVYVLMEKIKRDSDRIDIEKLNDYITDPALITGGYIFKKDKAPHSQPWNTARENIALDTHDPQSLNPEQFAWLRGHVNAFESALHSATFDDPESGYASYIDVPSFIDNHLFVEMFKEIDGYRISAYFTKTRNGKIRALPVWDYNLALGNADYLNGQFPTGWYYPQVGARDYPWYTRLFQDPEFVLAYWDRYWELRRNLFDDSALLDAIDGFDAELDAPNAAGQSAATRNFDRWNILGTYIWPNAAGYQSRTTHQAEVDWMKDWLTRRMEWIDTQSRGFGGPARPPSLSDYGGNVPAGFELGMADPNGWAGATIYFTTDGSDPRTPSTQSGTEVPFFTESSACEVLVPSAENGGAELTVAQWTGTGAPPNAQSWISGFQGVGYERATSGTVYTAEIGTDIHDLLYARNLSAYIRIPFTVASQATLDSLSQLALGMKYDDSFAIYLNGELVYKDARAPATLSWDSGSNGSHTDSAALVFEPIDLTPHIGKLQPGANLLAIHGLNDQIGSSDALWRAELTGFAGNANGPALGATAYSEPVTLSSSADVRARVFDGARWSPLTTGSFIVDTQPATADTLVVSELDYRPATPTAAEIAAGFTTRGDFEFIELMNIHPSSHIDLTGVQFADGIVFAFDGSLDAAVRTLAPGSRVVLASHPAGFAFRHGFQPAGTFGGALDNDGERIEIIDASGATIKAFTYNDVEPWPVDADGNGFTLVLIDPSSNPDHDDPTSWRSSVWPGGAPGATDAQVFTGNPHADQDKDGQSAFLEFVLGGSDTDGASQVLPRLTVESHTIDSVADDYLTVTFRINLAADGTRYWIEASSGLGSWQDATADFVMVSTTNAGDGTATVRYRSATPWSTAGSPGFFRLAVSG